MTTITPIYTGVAAHIGEYADAVAVSVAVAHRFSSPARLACAKTALCLRTSRRKPGSAGPMSKGRSVRPAPR